jgi:hypothetical protein
MDTEQSHEEPVRQEPETQGRPAFRLEFSALGSPLTNALAYVSSVEVLLDPENSHE